jgi:hypothetical protein
VREVVLSLLIDTNLLVHAAMPAKAAVTVGRGDGARGGAVGDLVATRQDSSSSLRFSRFERTSRPYIRVASASPSLPKNPPNSPASWW